MLAEYKIALSPQTPDSTDPEIRNALEKAKAQVGFIPNMYARMVNVPGLLDSYLHGYAAFRSQSGFSPAEQEVVLLAISRENACEYCVAAHSFMADNKSGVPRPVTDALREDRPLLDPKLQALVRFTRLMVAKRGLPSRQDVADFLAAGYAERHLLDIILAIGVKTISNYTNHLFHTPLDAVFVPWRWAEVPR